MSEIPHSRSCGQACCLRVEKLSVTMGNDTILRDMNLHVHCGELVALIGPNGAGKSTFLKAILGQREYTGVIAFSQPGQRSQKPREAEPGQPLGGSFGRFWACPPCLAPARLRRPHPKSTQNLSPRGASQFSRSGRGSSQEKRRREYPLIFSRRFPQNWTPAARENLAGFDSPRLKPRIGYVPQSPTFDPSEPMSVADLFACCMSKRPAFLGLSKAMESKVAECLERVHGTELIRKRVGSLSGGELQRVLLALALEPMPNILILDEPLSGVDVEGMVTLMDMLDEIRKTYDLSILMTTHDFTMLERYADQVVLIDGTVQCKGTPEEVLSSPAFSRTFHIRRDTL